MADTAEVDGEEEEEVVEFEEGCPECKKCPPVGAPAWMATFADMATLLMAFFVLILSFAEFNVPKFKQISGSLKNAFGVQRVVPIVEQPKGTTILSLNFSPSPNPSISTDMTQQTTSTAQPDLELKQKKKDDDGGESEAAEDIVRALEDAIARGEIEVETLGEKVVVNFTATESEQKDLPQLLRRTMNAIEKAQDANGKTDQEVLIGGLNEELGQLMADASAALEALTAADQATQNAASEQKKKNEKAKVAEDELKVALRQEIGEGLVAVEREEDKVIITVGAGGAFPSGSAELTDSAKEIMANIAGVNAEGSGKITVSGHTDDVPLVFGSQFRDNWDLAAARSASVVQTLEDTGMIPASRMEAVSYGESKPIESNSTADGRSVNRRIEIEINY